MHKEYVYVVLLVGADKRRESRNGKVSLSSRSAASGSVWLGPAAVCGAKPRVKIGQRPLPAPAHATLAEELAA
jgi:hypothetical protein